MAKLFEAMDLTFAQSTNLRNSDLYHGSFFPLLSPRISHHYCSRPSVSSLFRGSILDYIQCDKGHQRSRVDIFSEIALTIRYVGFFLWCSLSKIVLYYQIHCRGIDTLAKAFDKFEEVELMDGDNKWHCEQCDVRGSVHYHR